MRGPGLIPAAQVIYSALRASWAICHGDPACPSTPPRANLLAFLTGSINFYFLRTVFVVCVIALVDRTARDTKSRHQRARGFPGRRRGARAVVRASSPGRRALPVVCHFEEITMPMSDAMGAALAGAVANTTVSPPRVTPTASQPVRVPWGDWLAQALAHETHIVEAAAEAGVSLALGVIPFGSVVARFIGPTIVAQYVDMGLAMAEAALEPLAATVSGGSVLATVASLINVNEQAFASFFGDQVEPMIKAELAKRGIKF